MVSLEEAKAYLRVDTADEDDLIGTLIAAAENLCIDVARLEKDQWRDIDSEKTYTRTYCKTELAYIRETLRVAILYAIGYLFEHREEADHHDLALTLRSLLFSIREGVI